MVGIKQIPVGYQALIGRFGLRVTPHYRQSYIALHGRAHTHLDHHIETHVYPKTYAVKDDKNPFHHLEFSLKYDGVNLEILKATFDQLDSNDVQIALSKHPTSKYSRILWFLYEFLTEKKLKMLDSKRLKYVDVLDPQRYFTAKSTRSPRHRVNNNLIGNREFCPILRRSEALIKHIEQQYDIQAKRLTEKYDSQIIARASHYLYTKETLSSYKIEREKPTNDRMFRFVNILEKASSIEALTKELLVYLQNIIVDPRFKDEGYRNTQNYVGENINQYFQKIHYISPKPENIESLMSGLLAITDKPENDELHPVLLAAIVAFGFVFIHPFEDGNGRLHRFLIHYILSKKCFTPFGIIFPVSAVMLQKIHEYNRVLESFSKPIMKLITNYQLSNEGVLSVQQPTHSYYQYIDYSYIAEYLFNCIEETLHEHFEKEINHLVKYDRTKSEIQSEIDMPDKLIDLFIKFVLQNHGALSSQKRAKYFHKLTDKEIGTLQSIVCAHMRDRR